MSERLNKELEHALKVVRKNERTALNRDTIVDIVGEECAEAICATDYARYVDGRPESDQAWGYYNRIELTLEGRNYFRERRRDWIERYGPQVLGGIIAVGGTLGGVAFGQWLAIVKPFG